LIFEQDDRRRHLNNLAIRTLEHTVVDEGELDESTATKTGDPVPDSAVMSSLAIMSNYRIFYLPSHPTSFTFLA